MKQSGRKEELLKLLEASDEYLTASNLAQHFGVTRQVIVSDVALLRANGHKIIATQRGYALEKPVQGVEKNIKVIGCKHNLDDITNEFYCIVDNGGKILNVMIEHPLYGEISATLNITSRYDADQFMDKAHELQANQLCDLTNGFHFHTIEVPSEAAFKRIKAELAKLNILSDN